MFNEERKTLFISEIITTEKDRRAAAELFAIVEGYETRWGADVCTRKTEELQPLVNELGGLHGRKIPSKLLILRKYILWCYRGHVDGARVDLMKMSSDVSGNMRTEMVSGPEHLQKILDSAFRPEDEETADNLYRCAAWLVFAGIPSDDIQSVEADDVDFNEEVVRWNGTEFPIYPPAFKSIRKCMELDGFNRVYKGYTSWWARAEGKTLLRGSGGLIPTKEFRTQFWKAANNVSRSSDENPLPTLLNIGYSGVMFRAYQREKAGLPVDFLPDAERAVRRGKAADGKTEYYLGVRIRRVARDYAVDYEAWKAAFNLEV